MRGSRHGMAATIVLLGLAGCGFNEGDPATRGTGGFLGGTRPADVGPGPTVARLRGDVMPIAEPLRPEDGDVWPAPEAPRATLANPDAALRGIPSYNPAERLGPAVISTPPTTVPPAPPRGRIGSSTSPGPAEVPPRADIAPPAEVVAPRIARMPRPDGRVVDTPGGAAVTTGGNQRVQTYSAPDGSTGTVTRSGSTSTVIGSDGQVRVVPR